MTKLFLYCFPFFYKPTNCTISRSKEFDQIKDEAFRIVIDKYDDDKKDVAFTTKKTPSLLNMKMELFLDIPDLNGVQYLFSWENLFCPDHH